MILKLELIYKMNAIKLIDSDILSNGFVLLLNVL
jgi:hypothetical protein